MPAPSAHARAPVHGPAPRLPYLPGLDGLRAIAVVAVLLYHAELSWIPGGFLGVEVFFVISGYLITSLLLGEWRRSESIHLAGFWMRRARRLLPALFLVLGTVTAYAVLFLRDEVASLRGDLVAAVTYSTNWYLALSGESYFEAVGRPSLLQHLWSLAVEEQFYVLWPLLFTFGMRRFGRRTFLRLVVGGAAFSALLMALLFRPDHDPSFIYYGTHTRGSGLLLGAAFAFVWSPWKLHRPRARSAPIVLDVLGVVALVYLVRLLLVTSEFSTGLYRGGFVLVDLVTVVVIGVAVHPGAHLGRRVLGLRPLVWVGLRSYGIYLWHFPIFMVTRPQDDVPIRGFPLLVFRLVLTGLAAAASYRYVEMPVRAGALGRSLRALVDRRAGIARRTRLRWAGVTAAVLMTSGALSMAVAQAEPPDVPDFLADDQAVVSPTVTARTVSSVGSTGTTKPGTPTTKPGPTTTRPPAPPRVSAIGDSVMLGAVGALDRAFTGTIGVDARVGRSVGEGIGILRSWKEDGVLADVVVVHLGNNGTFSDRQFDELMEVLGAKRKVIVLNNRVARRWEGPNNEVIRQGARRYDNVVQLDWKKRSADHPEWFYEDDIHLRPPGAAAYAAIIKEKTG